MSVWSFKLMSVLVSSVKKVNRPPEVLTSPSDNSNTSSHCSSSTDVRPTDVTPSWYCTTSTRTSSMWCPNSTSEPTQLSQDRPSTSSSSISYTTSPWPPCQSFGTACSTSSTRETLRWSWNSQGKSTPATSWETHCCSELVSRELASRPSSSPGGYSTLLHMLSSSSAAASTLWLNTAPINRTVRILDSGLQVCLSTVFAFS